MQGAIVRFILNAAGLYLATQLVPGIHLQGPLWTILLVALIFGVVNALLHPLLSCLFSLINLLTLGLFLIVINGFLFWLADKVVKGVEVDGFGSAILGSLVTSLASWGIMLLLSHL